MGEKNIGELESSKPDSDPSPPSPAPVPDSTEMAISIPRDPEADCNPSDLDARPSWFTPLRRVMLYRIIVRNFLSLFLFFLYDGWVVWS